MNTEPLEIKDIYDVWYHPVWQKTWFVMGGIIISLVLIIVFAYWLYQKHHEKLEPEPWEVALEQLYKLGRSDFETPKFFYINLTGILKRYLQQRYGVSSIGTTDDELITTLRGSSVVPAQVTDTIKELLNGVVLIKFANQKAAQEQMQGAITQSIKLVESTVIVQE
jgi:hypothetical protein